MATRRLSILDALVARLGAISVEGGYNSNLSPESGGGGAQKTGATSNSMARLPMLICALEEGDRTGEREQEMADTAWLAERAMVVIEGATRDDGATPYDNQCEALLQDVERVLLNARTNPEAETGALLGVKGVEDIELYGHSKFYPLDGEDRIGFRMTIGVLYRHDILNPGTWTGVSAGGG